MQITPVTNRFTYNNLIPFTSVVVGNYTYPDDVYNNAKKWYDQNKKEDELYRTYDIPFAKQIHECLCRIKNEKKEEKIAEQEAKDEKDKRLKQKFIKSEWDLGLGECGLTKGQYDKLIVSVLYPFAMDTISKDPSATIPNGILITGSDDKHNEEVAYALARQVLRGNYYDNLVEISPYDIASGEEDEFRDDLIQIKEDAKNKYEKTKQRTIIYIPEFDKLCRDVYDDDYDSVMNNFMKAYFGDCASSGCTILATANSVDNIELPFFSNKSRFGTVLDLSNNEG